MLSITKIFLLSDHFYLTFYVVHLWSFFATISITEFLCQQLAVVFLLCCSGRQWAGGHGLLSSFVPMGLSFQMRCTEHACYHLALTMQISKKCVGNGWTDCLVITHGTNEPCGCCKPTKVIEFRHNRILRHAPLARGRLPLAKKGWELSNTNIRCAWFFLVWFSSNDEFFDAMFKLEDKLNHNMTYELINGSLVSL